MLTSIATFLSGAFGKMLLDWVWQKIQAWLNARAIDQGNHAESTQESSNQFEKLKKINEDSDAKTTREAINEASKHF